MGGINGNIDKTLYRSAVCAASEGCRMSLHVHGITTESAGLPTKTTWEKGKGEPATAQRNRRRHATQSENEVGDDWEGYCSQLSHSMLGEEEE